MLEVFALATALQASAPVAKPATTPNFEFAIGYARDYSNNDSPFYYNVSLGSQSLLSQGKLPGCDTGTALVTPPSGGTTPGLLVNFNNGLGTANGTDFSALNLSAIKIPSLLKSNWTVKLQLAGNTSGQRSLSTFVGVESPELHPLNYLGFEPLGISNWVFLSVENSNCSQQDKSGSDNGIFAYRAFAAKAFGAIMHTDGKATATRAVIQSNIAAKFGSYGKCSDIFKKIVARTASQTDFPDVGGCTYYQFIGSYFNGYLENKDRAYILAHNQDSFEAVQPHLFFKYTYDAARPAGQKYRNTGVLSDSADTLFDLNDCVDTIVNKSLVVHMDKYVSPVADLFFQSEGQYGFTAVSGVPRAYNEYSIGLDVFFPGVSAPSLEARYENGFNRSSPTVRENCFFITLNYKLP